MVKKLDRIVSTERVGRMKRVPEDPSLRAVDVCVDTACIKPQSVALEASDWQTVRALFSPRAPDAATERRQIGRAIARLEQIVGPPTHTANDVGGWSGNYVGGWFTRGNQQDCVSESYNTQQYLELLADDGLLRWHTVDGTKDRPGFNLPHRSAFIKEAANGQAWAVDSWVANNGEEPYIKPYEEWCDDPTAAPQ